MTSEQLKSHMCPARQPSEAGSESQAGDPGFEPGLTDPESVVLPLD
jgi:hypothetical protein